MAWLAVLFLVFVGHPVLGFILAALVLLAD